jgi:hypothetical protein
MDEAVGLQALECTPHRIARSLKDLGDAALEQHQPTRQAAFGDVPSERVLDDLVPSLRNPIWMHAGRLSEAPPAGVRP